MQKEAKESTIQRTDTEHETKQKDQKMTRRDIKKGTHQDKEIREKRASKTE